MDPVVDDSGAGQQNPPGEKQPGKRGTER
jgi:hypothetical protein